MKLKIGDPVICYKPIWMNREWRKGRIINIITTDDGDRIYYYSISSLSAYNHMHNYRFNIFPNNEQIILDKESVRDEKLKELGI